MFKINLSMKKSLIISIIIISYVLFYLFVDKNVFKYSNFEEWIKNTNMNQIYVFNENDYCIKNHQNLFYNYYNCCQNVQIKKNDLDISLLDEIEIKYYHTQSKSNNFGNLLLIIVFVSTYLITLFFYTIIYNIYLYVSKAFKSFVDGFMIGFNSTYKQPLLDFNSLFENKSSESTSPPISTTTSTFKFNTNLFDNLFNSNSTIEVKQNKDPTISLDNFIGCENIKKDINKLILQINYEYIYKTNNCELPKGLLLLGPPGVGKTHLVKTIINSTGMKHIFISGSDFNKKYVGSGSSLVTQLFKKARENKPCLIFIDEADTILKTRSHNDSAAIIDFNATICKFLAEMDSLKTESGVIIIFATNMDVENIDKAMIRAGRVDQIINISLPTFEERIDLFKMYLGELYDSQLIDINKISKLSYGLTGSDIKKIINLIKINKIHQFVNSNQDNLTKYKGINTYFTFFDKLKHNLDLKEIETTESTESTESTKSTEPKEKEFETTESTEPDETGTETIESKETETTESTEPKEKEFKEKEFESKEYELKKSDIKIKIEITTEEIDKEISKSIMGMERERKVNEMNKKIIAYHEAGHAILGFLIKNSIIPTKICISINSKSLGYTLFPQDDDDLLIKTTLTQLLIKVMILYGGRISEKIFIGDVTCGAEDDYLRARKIIKRLLMNGMLFVENNYLNPKGSEEFKLNEQMEIQLKNINKIIIQEIEILLNSNADIVHRISNVIIEYGSITSDDIYEIFKSNNMDEKIGSYDIVKIVDKIKSNI